MPQVPENLNFTCILF